MRAIIIEDKDAKSLLNDLKLTEFEGMVHDRESRMISEQFKIPDEQMKFIISSIHRRFHYRVCCWLQAQGASVI